MAHDIQRRGRRQRVGTQFCVKGPAGEVTNCPWKFWSAGEPDLGLPGLVREQLGSLASWGELGPVQWCRGWKTKTGRRAAAKRAKLGTYVATKTEKLTHIRNVYGSGSLLLKILWNSLEKKILKYSSKYFIYGFDPLENLLLPTWVWDLASKGVLAKIWGGRGGELLHLTLQLTSNLLDFFGCEQS